MKCITNNWSCAYHACMSNDCQKEEVLKYHPGFGKGECEKKAVSANFKSEKQTA